MSKKIKYLVAPNPLDTNLTKEINGFNESFKKTLTKTLLILAADIFQIHLPYVNHMQIRIYQRK